MQPFRPLPWRTSSVAKWRRQVIEHADSGFCRRAWGRLYVTNDRPIDSPKLATAPVLGVAVILDRAAWQDRAAIPLP
jgi:hypothetical protein